MNQESKEGMQAGDGKWRYVRTGAVFVGTPKQRQKAIRKGRIQFYTNYRLGLVKPKESWICFECKSDLITRKPVCPYCKAEQPIFQIYPMKKREMQAKKEALKKVKWV